MPPKRAPKQTVDKKNGKPSKAQKSAGTTELPKENESKGKEKMENTSAEDSTKMTLCTEPSVSAPRPQRRPGRPPTGKRLTNRDMPGKVRSVYRRSMDPCDNSNDSGLGFDHHTDPHHHTASMSERLTWSGERAEPKRPRMEIKLEHYDTEVNDNYCFPETIRQCKDNISLIRTAPNGSVPSLSITNNNSSSTGRAVPRCLPLSARQTSASPVPLTTQLSSTSRYSEVSLQIVKQPEQQHRARYQTEGSRGAVKDREGNGFPVVQLKGYYHPVTLQVFIGTDVDKVAPHMFYQACKVSGKNSTPCVEKKIDGTCVIELGLEPSKDMSATCDCVGILKERNVDVEHRFPDQLGNRSKKKSTRCRMIFRTTITHDNGTQETLQVCSQPIVCTQPPGVPEICKKSLTSCPASGGLELFVLGKNFLKDTKVYFQQYEDGRIGWEQAVIPDKEYLQQTHFVCVVPPYRRPDITEPVSVRLCVVSSGKTSETHQFVYTPVNGAMPSVHMAPQHPQPAQFFKGLWQTPPPCTTASTSISKHEHDLDMMPPPESNLVPMRRPSVSLPSTSEIQSPPLHALKQEYIDESSQSSLVDMEVSRDAYRPISESSMDVNHGDSNMSMMNENSMDILHHQNSMMSHYSDNSNISVGNEDSIDMVGRRNSIHRSTMCENSVDLNSNSNMPIMNDNSTCSTATLCSNPIVTPSVMPLEKVMDLRMKMPLVTTTDFVSMPSSMVTLQRFGIEPSNGPLPTQSGQSVENYLTRIESKTLTNNVLAAGKLKLMVTEPTCNGLLTSQNMSRLAATEAEFLSTQRSFIASEAETMSLVSKSEAASIAERGMTANTITACANTVTLTTTLERSIPTPINTEKLDDFVNCTAESHIGNTPARGSKIPASSRTNVTSEVIMSQDVMMNTNASLIVPSSIMTSRMPSPIMNAQEPHSNSSNLSPEIILNSQISPSLMCRSTTSIPQEPLLSSSICQPTVTMVEPALTVPQQPLLNANICQPSVTMVEPTLTVAPQPMLSTNTVTNSVDNAISTLHSPILATESEKAVLLEAAADFLETQKKISELRTATTDILTMSSTETTPMQHNNLSQLHGTITNNFVPFTTTTSNALLPKSQKSDFIPLPVKEMAAGQNDKKNDDRMIPQSFTALSENELINLINPSCFDQGNNSYQ